MKKTGAGRSLRIILHSWGAGWEARKHRRMLPVLGHNMTAPFRVAIRPGGPEFEGYPWNGEMLVRKRAKRRSLQTQHACPASSSLRAKRSNPAIQGLVSDVASGSPRRSAPPRDDGQAGRCMFAPDLSSTVRPGRAGDTKVTTVNGQVAGSNPAASTGRPYTDQLSAFNRDRFKAGRSMLA